MDEETKKELTLILGKMKSHMSKLTRAQSKPLNPTTLKDLQERCDGLTALTAGIDMIRKLHVEGSTPILTNKEWKETIGKCWDQL